MPLCRSLRIGIRCAVLLNFNKKENNVFFFYFYPSLTYVLPTLPYVPPRFLLEREKEDLLEELRGLPNNAVIRRINELVKRARSVKVHAYIIHYLRKQASINSSSGESHRRSIVFKVLCMLIHYTTLNGQMPYTWGKQEKQQKLLSRLHTEFLGCARR